MNIMRREIDIKGLLAMASKLDALEAELGPDDRVTADDKMNIVKQIETLRKKIRRSADDLEYDNTQLLTDRLREVTHILSDIISARAVKGEDTKMFLKLNSKIVDVTKALSLGGDEDTEDKNKDGFRDDVKVSFLEDEDDKDDEDEDEDPKSVFHKAVNKALNKPAPEAKAPSKEAKHSPPKENSKKKEDDDSEDNEDDESKEPKSEKKAKLEKPSKKSKPSKKAKSGGFLDSLDEDEEADASVVTAGLRFSYLGVVKIKIEGVPTQVLKAMYGNTEKPNAAVYYYKPTDKLLGGDVAKVDLAFKKTLKEDKGYHALAVFIPKLIRSGKLIQIKKKDADVTAILHDGADNFWSYIGVQEHPTKENKRAIWFEIGDKQFAAVPSKKFEAGDVQEASNWIKVNVLGGKEAGGESYLDGLKMMNDLVHSGKLKVVFHGAV